jgi:universal stress protein A
MAGMKSYKHILYATDLGPHEKSIRSRVKSISEQNDAKISLVHVVETFPIFMDMSGYLNTVEIIERIQQEAKELVNKIAKDLTIEEANQHISLGSPKTDIIALANKIKADLIVIGAHNRHLIDNLIGSTTDAVLRSANCDVLAVRYNID